MDPDTGASSSANWAESTAVNPPPGQNDLPTLAGSRESGFVAERPFRNLAADIDALFGVTPADTSVNFQPVVGSYDFSGILPPCDSFASLFSNGDRECWEQFTLASLG